MGVIGSLMVAGLLAVIGRVYYLQTVQKEQLVESARDQTAETVELRASRGKILDRNGVELAVTTDVPSLYARPGQIDDPGRAAEHLSPHLPSTTDEIAETLSSDEPFVWLARKTQPNRVEAIRELEIRGVGSLTESKRYYPLGALAGQLLGFVGIDGAGLEGIERMLDETLTGETYEFSGMRDAKGRTIMSQRVPDLDGLQGNTVKLTIDKRIQRVAERAVARQVESHRAKTGHGVVLDVDTGEVLAMANTPSFDPNRFEEFESGDWRLRAVTDSFEPGSVFKPFVLAAALEEGTVSLHTQFDCENGALEIGGHVVRDSHPMEELTTAEIIQKSSNIGAYKVAKTIGRGKLYDFTRAFGFGSRTGFGLRGEQPGVVRPPDGWAKVTFANIAFGQGITATPIQVATGMAAIANGGLLLEPRVVGEVRTSDGRQVRGTEPRLVRRVVSEETARKTSKAMSLVTLEEGTGTNAALQDFTVAGKTGTAQKVDPETGTYAPDKWISSFVGFAPAEDPEVLALVMVDEPQDETYGGIVAAPAVRTILEKGLSVRGAVPLAEERRFDRSKYVDLEGSETEDDGSESDDGSRSDDGRGWSRRDVDDSIERVPAEVLPAMPVGEGASEGSRSEGGNVVGPTVPDLRGMTLRAAVRRAEERSIPTDVEGWGRVVAQRPRPGTKLASGQSLSLVLAPRRAMRRASDEPAHGADADRERRGE